MKKGKRINIIGGGLAGSEAALTLGNLGFDVTLYEMRPVRPTPVHHGDGLAELVCSNSLKSMKPESAAGMLKRELDVLGSNLYGYAIGCRIAAGGALGVDRNLFSDAVTRAVQDHPGITLVRREMESVCDAADGCDALILATGPLTSDALSSSLAGLTGSDALAFYDAAAPVVLAASIDMDKVFRQNRYEDTDGGGDYLNAPFTKEEYDAFIAELVSAKRVVAKEFETSELFQACQPIEEIARKGNDAPRFGTMKPVGLTDPRTGRRPWAALQLRQEDSYGQSYNLVGFQTNLTFPEQKRVFSMIPGLENAEFTRYGVMHRNTFIDSPRLLDWTGKLISQAAERCGVPVYVAGQLSGTEGYCEAIRSGLHCAFSVAALLGGAQLPKPPSETVYGALLDYATSPDTADYQPMHVNFGIMPPLEKPVKKKAERYAAYSRRGEDCLQEYAQELRDTGLLA